MRRPPPETDPAYKGRQKTAEEIAKDQVEIVRGIADAAQEGRRTRMRLNQLQQHLQEGGSGLLPALQLYASDWGINLGEGVDELQAARAIINALVPAQRPAGSGPMSDNDLELFKQSLPRIINQPGGNQLILDTLMAIADYDIARGQAISGFYTGELDYAGAQARLAELDNPLEWVRASEGEGEVNENLRSSAQAELERRQQLRSKSRRRNRGARQ